MHLSRAYIINIYRSDGQALTAGHRMAAVDFVPNYQFSILNIPAELIPYLATKEEVFAGNEHYYHLSGYMPTGLEVVNESGTVLHTLNFPKGETIWPDKEGDVIFMKNGDKIWAIIEEDYAYLYDLSKSSNAIMSVKTNPKEANKRYNLQGQPVGEGYKGIVIQGGKKMIRR